MMMMRTMGMWSVQWGPLLVKAAAMAVVVLDPAVYEAGPKNGGEGEFIKFVRTFASNGNFHSRWRPQKEREKSKKSWSVSEFWVTPTRNRLGGSNILIIVVKVIWLNKMIDFLLEWTENIGVFVAIMALLQQRLWDGVWEGKAWGLDHIWLVVQMWQWAWSTHMPP